MKIGVNLDCIACKAVYPQAGPKPPTSARTAVQGQERTIQTKTHFVPFGINLLLHEHKFWKPKECKATACCLENETCKDGHGCQ